MIAQCNKCNKKFIIDSNLIPKKGRLLQCSNCNYKWIFKIKDATNLIAMRKSKNLTTSKTLLKKKKRDSKIKLSLKKKEIIKKKETTIHKNSKIKKKFNIFKLLLALIISFIGVIILLDTIGVKVFSYIEFLLLNLDEFFKSFFFFIKNLI